ncbi:MAG TPA: glycoside hydrolase family 15 protein [Terriglobales bacterium]
MASKIEDYGMIGNTYTSALVSRSGSIDWLCAPRFDSDACFAALVGYDEHGRWSLRPTVQVRETRQRYREDTMILETEFVCDGGGARIIDFMPVGSRCDVVRIVEGVEGEVLLEMLLNVRFGYGFDAPLIRKLDDGTYLLAGPDAVVLRCPLTLEHARRTASAYFRVKKGERVPLQLTWFPSHEQAPEAIDVERSLASTESFWREWAGRCTYRGRWRDAIVRSMITLKAMTYAPTGAIVAAPTTSLPEELGGVRNWDYRFCWVRDASLTLDSLMRGGYVDEARAFRDWLVRAVAGDPPDLQIMYNVFGGRRLTEFELDWLPGYEGSKPVRVGNAASGQFQLDIYGESMASLYSARKMGMLADEVGWLDIKDLIVFMEDAWQRPDDGIWEVRGGRRHFTHSKVMAWAFFDRIVKSINEFGMGGDEGRKMLPHLGALRDRTHSEICSRGFNPRVQAFTQSYGSDVLDASVLVIPHYGFLPADDPRMRSTVAAIEKDLLRDGFVLRYDTRHGNDGLPGSEGAFLACTFWLADNYAFSGRIKEAENLFERLLSLRNHLGLLSEEYDWKLQRQIGNFPQAFSHLALIQTAFNIENM